MKYQKQFNIPKNKKFERKQKKKHFGKYRKRLLRILLKNINFEIQNSEFKKIRYHYYLN